jgi:hypothetical protein
VDHEDTKRHEDCGTDVGGPDRAQQARIEAEAPLAYLVGGLRPQAQEPGQAERAVMHPEADDAEWRYYFGAWHS